MLTRFGRSIGLLAGQGLSRTRITRGFKKTIKPFDESEFVYTNKLDFIPGERKIETFRVIDLDGNVIAPKYDNVELPLLAKVYEYMVRLEIIDDILLKSQRQGKISFYMTSFGETAAVLGTTAALKFEDMIYTQYREQGSFLWRGFTIDQMIAQCAGNKNDPASGRQMPVHYCDVNLNQQCISSPLATQIPHAAGAGYKYRINKEDRIAVTYFGEGTSSEGDFHAGMNFAATLGSQTLFICRNNKYAISTSSEEQFNTDGVAIRGPAYGMKTIRVDGNDAIAVIQATRLAREYIVKNRAPVFLEAMTYRVGDHSTSDYSLIYREEKEIDTWRVQNDPIKRLGSYLKKKNAFPFKEEEIKALRKSILDEVAASLKRQSETPLPKPDLLFEQVYDQPTANLLEQRDENRRILREYPEEFKLERYDR